MFDKISLMYLCLKFSNRLTQFPKGPINIKDMLKKNLKTPSFLKDEKVCTLIHPIINVYSIEIVTGGRGKQMGRGEGGNISTYKHTYTSFVNQSGKR